MKPEFKQPWIDALRSGKYVKGRASLNIHEKFCCLGVLAEITSDEHGTKKQITEDRFRYFDSYATFDSEAQSFFGLTDNNCDTLMCMNDSLFEPKSFNDIADWIEENL